MAEEFMRIGAVEGSRDPFARKPPFRFTPEELVELTTIDPATELGQARMRGLFWRVDTRSDGFTDTADRRLIRQLQEVPVTSSGEPPAREPYKNPARLEGTRHPTGLDESDREFARVLADVAPEAVSDDDVQHLAELQAAAATESERRLIGRVLTPIRRHHDRLEETAELRSELAATVAGRRSPAVRTAVEPLLTERLAARRRAELEPRLAEVPPDRPQLRESVLRDIDSEVAAARREAPVLLRDRWAALDAEVAERTAAAQVRLHALACGAEPVSSEAGLPPLPDPSLADARERGRQWREQRAGDPDAFSEFETVGAAGGSGSAA